MKHTPGPWEVVCNEDAQEWSIDAPNGESRMHYQAWEELAVVYGSDDWPGEGAAIARANAHLIAAAPDLLEALTATEKALANAASYRPHIRAPDGDRIIAALTTARRALAKARGES